MSKISRKGETLIELKWGGYEVKKYKILITQDGEVIDQIECDSFLLARSTSSELKYSAAGNTQDLSELLFHLQDKTAGKFFSICR